MNVLVVGSGGREHALCWKLKKSDSVKKLYCAPGNGGIASVAQCVDIAVEDIAGLIKFAKERKIDLTVVGPEVPLVNGIVDEFLLAGLKIFGPSKKSAQLEGSKVFSKEFMQRHSIPTAEFETFDNLESARAFLAQADFPLVIKASGLAAGKGVVLCNNRKEGEQALDEIMRQKVFKGAGDQVVIEEFLKGEEASILAVSDGMNYVILDSAQDHKRIFDDDLGPNTGGMGAYSPAPVVTESMLRKVETRIIGPTIRGMAKEGIPFKGILYAGIMITEDGPKVLEYNVRFGDPETQALLPRLKTDLFEVMLAACEGRLEKVSLRWDRRTCVCVVMSSGGYPGKYKTGYEICGLEQIKEGEEAIVFHAGTKKDGEKILTSGGRVLGVTALGLGVEEAIRKVYEAVEKIKFDHCFFRRDIAAKAVRRPKLTAASRSK